MFLGYLRPFHWGTGCWQQGETFRKKRGLVIREGPRQPWAFDAQTCRRYKVRLCPQWDTKLPKAPSITSWIKLSPTPLTVSWLPRQALWSGKPMGDFGIRWWRIVKWLGKAKQRRTPGNSLFWVCLGTFLWRQMASFPEVIPSSTFIKLFHLLISITGRLSLNKKKGGSWAIIFASRIWIRLPQRWKNRWLLLFWWPDNPSNLKEEALMDSSSLCSFNLTQ